MDLPELAMGCLAGLAGLAAGLAIDAGARRYVGRERGAAEAYSVAGAVCTASIAGVISLAAWAWSPAGLIGFTMLLGWLLLALAAIDVRTHLLPDTLNAAVLLLGAGMVWITRPEAWAMHLAGAAIGYGALWAVESAYRRVRGHDGLGRGDAKLLGALGMWVGALGLPPVLLIASLSGIAAALVQSWRTGAPLSGQSAIAFGPWIALGGFAVWLLQGAAGPALGLG